MYKVRELNRVADEKYRCVISHHVVVSFFGVEFNGEATRISCRIRAATLSSDGRETNQCGCFFPNFIKESCLGVLRDVMSYFEVSVSSSSFGVDYSFRNSLTIKFGKFVNQREVLE